MAEVLLKNVTKIYESKNVAVKDANVEVKDKEFVILVGPSGCGKSTMLRMIAGLEEITSGEIFIDGKLVNNISPKDRDIAMVFQNYALYPHMTVFENIAFGLKLRKFSSVEIKNRVDEAAEILDLKNYLDRKPKQLSGGQRQRVAVGRAIVRKPKVFLFDEPLSNLDAKLRVQMRTEISRLHKNLEATMIYVTHDQTEAMTMGDRIVILKDGNVQQVGTPMKLYDNPLNKFVAGFIGSPSMNFITGKIDLQGKTTIKITGTNSFFELNDEQINKLKNYSDKEIIIGIRPENIEPSENTSAINKIKVKIEVVEPMGNETFLYFVLQNTQMIARVGAKHFYKAGDEVSLHFDRNKLYFFDKEDGNAI